MNAWLMTLLSAGILVGLAGCATPEETADNGLDPRGGADDGLGNDDTTTPDRIRVGGDVYECDDTLDADGSCDSYERQDDATTGSEAQDVTAGADGTIEVGGQTYACEDADDVATGDEPTTVGACERYERDG